MQPPPLSHSGVSELHSLSSVLVVELIGCFELTDRRSKRFLPLLAEDLLQFGVLCCLQGWRRCQWANRCQVLHQLNVLPRTIGTALALTVEPLGFKTVIVRETHYELNALNISGSVLHDLSKVTKRIEMHARFLL